MKAWLLILLKLDKFMLYYEKIMFPQFLTKSVLLKGVRGQNPPQKGFHCIFNRFLHWVLKRLDGLVYDDEDWCHIKFQGHWVASIVKGVRNIPRKRYWVYLKQYLCGKICSGLDLRRSFDSISLKLERMVSTMEELEEMEMYSFWTKSATWRWGDKGLSLIHISEPTRPY